ncbi:LegC family aminotransferase [Anaerocolumna sedimenticola]|uniref:LegC family aminotransferase n=1 Tax=Anaerocolumna sedimenticola TaxID=2696063 RepID=A0A6P1TKQ7_9FIRM|nr:LegC family aminotransferase [Anaerocolumna sedimenticola]QHQ60692.1 LegC family aminotransferase [Anaerocolumna sedimenticola]
MGKFIPLSVPNLKGNELEYITNAIETEWVSTAGPYISDFEKNIASYVGTQEAIACQNGTAGLHLALLVCGVTEEDIVIVPTLTFIAAVNPVKYIGAEPLFMDCDDSLTMDPLKLEKFCDTECDFIEGKLIDRSSGKHIKAIVIVHVFGNMADMERIVNIANKYHIKLIEDATEALGSYYTSGLYQGKYAGTIGDIGVYSFNGNKIITTGGGGMIVSNNQEYLDRSRYLSTQAKNDILYFVHDEVGYNYRMTNLQAALGLAQLEQLEKFISTKRENYFEYKKQGLLLLGFREDIRPNYWFYSYITDYRDAVLQFMERSSIQARPIWKLIHTLQPYKGARAYRIEKAYYYYDHVLNIPCSSNLSKEDVEFVVDTIKGYGEEKQ